jgi:membrane-bound inhibitor of C-type lysozyme
MSTSNRKQAFQTPQANPATKFINWKSNDKNFSFYDKELKENIAIPLPFKFLVLDELHSVKGWNDASSSSIYSNEVKFISKETMTVKSFKGGEIAKGFYKDIKEKIVASGGHYTKSIYVMLEDGSLANLQLKGSAVQMYGEFTQKTKSRLTDEWVQVASAKEGKKGAVKFNTPEFSFLKSLNEVESEQADEAFNILESYLKTYLNRSTAAVVDNIEVVDEAILEDDLEF